MNSIVVAQNQPVASSSSSSYDELTAAYDIINDDWTHVQNNAFSLSDQIRFNAGGFKIKNREVLRKYGSVWSYYIREMLRNDNRLMCNSDPWNRQFKMYENEGELFTNSLYRCDAIRINSDKIISYVYITTISGMQIYCVDNIV